MPDLVERRALEEKRFLEALNSPRLDNSSVTKIGLKRIVKDEGHNDSYTMQQAVECVLYQMLVNPSMAERISNVMDQWIDWTKRGGHEQEHMDSFEDNSRFMLFFLYHVADSGFFEGRRQCGSEYAGSSRLYRNVRLG